MVTETPARGASLRRDGARLRRWARVLLLAAACALVSGCATPYLLQAAAGEWRLLHRRQPIDSLLADASTPPALRSHLEEVRAAREFASSELGLPDNASYRSYADIGRPYVVWNVVAADEFSVEPKRWCFPVVGCVAYRGYFGERRAREYANALAVRGFDVVVDGVPAFSTLGRFADPVLSSMLPYGDDALAATIFHELAHQLLYLRDDTEFNEAFATTVENAGLERWLTHQGAAERLRRFRALQADEAAVAGLLANTRARLARLYASGAARDEMRARKAEAFTALAAGIRALERREGVGYPLYDQWIAEGLNNARLVSVSTYFGCLPGFSRVLERSGGDLKRFYAAVRELARLPRAQRHARLCVSPVGEMAALVVRRAASAGDRPIGRRSIRIEVGRQQREHRPRLDAEPSTAVLAAHRIEGERAEVVEGEGLAGQQPQDEALQPCDDIGQRDDPTGEPRHACREAHDLFEGQHLRAAQLIGLTRAAVPIERAQQGLDDIEDADGREASPGAGERQYSGAEAQ